jgi:hypothetical protein
MTGKTGEGGNLSEVWQFWSRQVEIVAVAIVATALMVLFYSSVLDAVPQSGFEALSSVFATLLGLTFTAFSILTTFMPGLRRDFVKSRTFGTIGKTFVLTMGAQMAAFALSVGSFVFYEPGVLKYAAPPTILFAILSVGLMGELMAYMFSMFRMARREL